MVEDYIDLNFHIAYASIKNYKLKESFKNLKTLEIDMRKA